MTEAELAEFYRKFRKELTLLSEPPIMFVGTEAAAARIEALKKLTLHRSVEPGLYQSVEPER